MCRVFFREASPFSFLLVKDVMARWFPSFPPSHEEFSSDLERCLVTKTFICLFLLFSSHIKDQYTINKK